MPTTTTSTMFFLGNFADMDTDESDWDLENTGTVLGNHDDLSLVDVTNHDQDDDGAIFDDDDPGATSDFISYDTGSGPTSVSVDSSSLYNAVITLGDGSTSSIQVIVVQAANGDVFLVDFNTELDNLNVQSIELTSHDSSNYAGYSTSRSVENSAVVCFAAGTQITTPEGEVAVEDLRPGMLVTTMDHGAQPILWINRTNHLKPGKQASITLEPGCLGPRTPARRLRVSPQHRILLRSAIVERMCDTAEVLVAAKHLLPLDGITQSLGFLPVQYHHFACARHEVVVANGAEVETFFTGTQAMKTISDIDLRQMRRQIAKAQFESLREPARPFLVGKRLKQMIARHQKNRRDFVEPSHMRDRVG
ncbi:Hint domain-containing protein [Sedimentitalea todarodis]|uniref:Hint domain-containing protein n=1 Tax=Sedimentitalea todarodis TaxID=1631240 RepID=A0ABU3VJ45_9RHOB|nr:Hint domain-containing protein [Sedimentitalea todarodis]MDU9006196.1 Hint domain-containing protein [Sedimentitalea todarodis]